MKATIEVPDELYRRVKAKSTREGRALREVTVELYQRYIGDVETPEPTPRKTKVAGDRPAGRAIPSWFGALGRAAQEVKQHDMETIRRSRSRPVIVGLDTSVLVRVLTGEPRDLALVALDYLQERETVIH